MDWAERLKFEGNDGETLNYTTLVLGRTGHLVVNGFGGLVAGKLALKVGLFARLALLLKAFLEPTLVGVVLPGGLLVKLLRRRQGPDAAPRTERGA